MSELLYRVLGRLEIRVDGVDVEIGTPKERALLAVLLINANRVVSVDRLTDELWGEEPPGKAMASLQAYVSRLRRLLEPERAPRAPSTVLVTDAPGYRLRVLEGELDSARFETAAAEARALLAAQNHVGAEQAAAAALALWRGDAFGELNEEPFALREAARLHELQLEVVEDRLAARIATGDLPSTIADIEAHTATHPLRERGWELLMTALYASGRQADALRAYQRVRTHLGEEMGLAPGPRLQDLEAAILDQSPQLPVTAGPSLALRSNTEEASGSLTELVGRDDSLVSVRAALDAARAGEGTPQWIVVSGEAGIGKSALAREIGTDASRIGFAVVTAGNDEQGGAPAYWMWTQCVDALLASIPGDRAEALRRRLPVATAPSADPVDGPQTADERFRLHDQMVQLLESVAAARPFLLVVEDVQWSDDESRALLAYVARNVKAGPVVFVVTHRDDPESRPADLLGGVTHVPAVVRIELAGLDETAVRQLAHRETGTDLDEADVRELSTRTRGNPFFVLELTRLWASEGGTRSGAVPAAVADVVRRRLGRLPEDARAVLTVAAVCGTSFEIALLEEVCGLDAERLLDLVDGAVMHRVVIEGDQHGVFEFSHALVRDAVLSYVGPLRRARLNAHVAAALEQSDRAQSAAQLAAYWYAALPVGHSEPATRWCYAAAEEAEAANAFTAATKWWNRALEADGSSRAELLLRLGRAQIAAGLAIEGRATLIEAFDTAESSGDHATMIASSIAFGEERYGYQWSGFRESPTEVVARMERTLAGLDDADIAERCRVLSTLAIGWYNDDAGRCDSLSAAALAMAERLGGEDLIAATALDRAAAQWRPDTIAEQLDLCTYVLTLDTTDEIQGAASVQRELCLLVLADIDVVDRERDRLAEISERSPRPLLLAQAATFDATRALIAGDLDRAELLATRAYELNQGVLGRAADATLVGQLLTIRREQGRVSEIQPLLEQLCHEGRIHPLDLVSAAFVEAGDHDALRALSTEPAAVAAPPYDWFWPAEMVLRADVAVALRDRELARVQYQRLVPHRGQATCAGAFFFGPVDWYLARLAELLGDRTAVADHVRLAAATADRLVAPRWQTRIAAADL